MKSQYIGLTNSDITEEDGPLNFGQKLTSSFSFLVYYTLVFFALFIMYKYLFSSRVKATPLLP